MSRVMRSATASYRGVRVAPPDFGAARSATLWTGIVEVAEQVADELGVARGDDGVGQVEGDGPEHHDRLVGRQIQNAGEKRAHHLFIGAGGLVQLEAAGGISMRDKDV